MATISITMKDGTVHTFEHEGRSGGSYTKRLELKDGWAIVTDEYERRTAFPAADVAKVEDWPDRW